MKETYINYDNLPMHSVWDGSPIRRTVNCNDCEYFFNTLKDRESLEICAWGVAWKVLEEVEKPVGCLKINKKLPEHSSLNEIQRFK
jgi:hypothetical protein